MSEDLPVLERIAKKRTESARAAGHKDKAAGADKLKRELHGVAGEWAAAMLYGLPDEAFLDISQERSLDGLRAGDVLNGMIQVKTRLEGRPDRWDLIVNEDTFRRDKPYLACLSCWYPRFVVIAGWAWGHEIAAHNQRGSHGESGHQFLIYPLNRLRHPMDLFTVIRHRQLLDSGPAPG